MMNTTPPILHKHPAAQQLIIIILPTTTIAIRDLDYRSIITIHHITCGWGIGSIHTLMASRRGMIIIRGMQDSIRIQHGIRITERGCIISTILRTILRTIITRIIIPTREFLLHHRVCELQE